MSLLSKNPGLLHRIKLYLIGFAFGLFLVSFLYKGESCKMPGSIKLQELTSQHLTINDSVLCIINCNKLNSNKIIQQLKNGKINYTQSDVHAKPYPFYSINFKYNSKDVIAIIVDIDTISQLKHLSGALISSQSCECK